MNRSVVRTLILTDLDRHRVPILITVCSGLSALALLQIRQELTFIAGATWFFIGLIVLGCILPISNIINERKKQTLAFLMSLPMSIADYTAAKLVSTVGMFLLPWLTLVVAALTYIVSDPDIPDGIVPVTIILSTMPLTGFCLIAAVSLVTESEGVSMAATIVANSSYGFCWYLLARNPAIRGDFKSRVPVWSPEVLKVLGLEFGIILVLLALTFYLQSRKRDFV